MVYKLQVMQKILYAMTQLGNNYMNGLGVPKDYKKQ